MIGSGHAWNVNAISHKITDFIIIEYFSTFLEKRKQHYKKGNHNCGGGAERDKPKRKAEKRTPSKQKQ